MAPGHDKSNEFSMLDIDDGNLSSPDSPQLSLKK